jgi:RNA recognition motif-containing protein
LAKKLYIGNLPFNASEDELRETFEQHGEVISVRIITDRDTGRSRGFGFVEMAGGDVENAIKQLDGRDFGGRTLRVSEARERQGPAPRARL